MRSTIATSAASSVPRQQRAAAASARKPVGRKDWTVLAFLNGNNDLEPDLVRNLMDADRVGPNPRLNFVAELGRAPQSVAHPKGGRTHLDGDWSGVRRYETRFLARARKGRNIAARVVDRLPPFTDMGSPNALADFLLWGIKNYPAKRYAIVISSHGDGFKGVSFDDVHDSRLKPRDIRQVLEHVRKETGVKPELLIFDCCKMGQTEVAYEVRNQAKYLLGAEDIIGNAGLPFAKVLSHAAFEPDLSARKLADAIVDESAADQSERMDRGDEGAAGQFAAIDLSRMDDLRRACDGLSRALRAGGVGRRKLVEIVQRTKRFRGKTAPGKDFRDLGDFARNLLASRVVTDARLRKAAQNVLDVLSTAVIAHHTEGDGMARAHGLSIYLPTDGGRDPAARKKSDPWSYGKLEMSQDGEWPALIEHLRT